ncbi:MULTISPECIES: glycosyltransferase [unclassified Pseudomonas]|uniref:glycosyltransferase n=1 Tax=unclassified Pseudomonas TaxID=196821 RepID=UPI0025DECB3A|nr:MULTISPECIES: glycosyltransferase [unclassified Pseudomonas]
MNVQRLVSIVIPAYKPTYFEAALRSAFAQDYDQIEIVICDDCRDDGIHDLLARLTPDSPWPIRYFRNEHALGEALNVARGIKEARGEYIKFLYDDDMLEFDCVSTLIELLQGHPDITLAAATRRLIDEEGEFLPDNLATFFPFKEDVIIHGPELVALLSETPLTFMGEPSAVMCRRDDVLAYGQDLMSLKGQIIHWLGDISLYVKLLRQGNLALLKRPLSRFRVTDTQSSSIARAMPQVAQEGHETYFRITKELHWRRAPALNGDVKIAPLSDRENFSNFNLRAYVLRKSLTEQRHDQIQDWASSRRSVGPQKTHITRYFQQHNGTPGLAIIVSDLLGRPQQLRKTLGSIETTTQGWMAAKVFVLHDASNGQPPPEPADSAIYLEVSGQNRAAQLNHVLQQAGFDWFMIIDAGSTLNVAGLLKAAIKITELPTLRALFADEIARTQAPTAEVMLRPDFSLDYLLSFPQAMARHWIFNRYAVVDAGGFDARFAQALELDVILRLIEHEGLAGLEHVSEPLITYTPESSDANPDEARTLQRHLLARGYEHGQVTEARPRHYQLRYGHAQQPKVSIIVTSRDQILLLQRCVESILGKTTYPHYEIIIADSDSQTPQALAWLAGVEAMQLDQVRVLRFPAELSRSAINNLAARHATGEYLVLLSNSAAILHGDWLDNLLNHAQRPEVGVVGAKLLAPDNTIQHAGIVLGLEDPVTYVFSGQSAASDGYMQRLVVDQNYSAVSQACLMIGGDLYDALGGLDEGEFDTRYGDVDLCLRVKESGRLIVWTPHVVLLHDATEGDAARDGNHHALYGKWLNYIAHDPAYNDNFSSRSQGLQLETFTEVTWRPLPWRPVPLVLSHPHSLATSEKRLVGPLDALAEALQIEHVRSPQLLTLGELTRLHPETLILQRPWTDAAVSELQTISAFSQALRIYDVSQYPPSSRDIPGAPSPEQINSLLRNGLGLMDKVIVSSTGLADALSGFHARIEIIEERLEERWRNVQCYTLPRGKPRVGWVGTSAQLGELALIEDVIQALGHEVEWIIMGPCPESIRPWVHEWRSPVEGELYPGVLGCLDLDVALIPAGSSLFGEHKSTRLALELGACGYPIVASDVPGLRNALPLTRVQSGTQAWLDAIAMHINDLDEAKRLGQRLKQAVLNDWMLDEAYLQRWRAALLDR